MAEVRKHQSIFDDKRKPRLWVFAPDRRLSVDNRNELQLHLRRGGRLAKIELERARLSRIGTQLGEFIGMAEHRPDRWLKAGLHHELALQLDDDRLASAGRREGDVAGEFPSIGCH